MLKHDKGCQSIDDHHVTDGITFKSCNCILSKITEEQFQHACLVAAEYGMRAGYETLINYLQESNNA